MQIVIRRNVVRSNVLQRFRVLGKIVSAIASEISLWRLISLIKLEQFPLDFEAS